MHEGQKEMREDVRVVNRTFSMHIVQERCWNPHARLNLWKMMKGPALLWSGSNLLLTDYTFCLEKQCEQCQ